MKQAGAIKRKGSGHFGSFFFGTLIGFLVTILLIVGAGAFIYFNVSPKWINNTFHAGLSLGNDELDSLTLSKIVSHAMKLGQNIDTYTLNDLKSDFGVDIGDNLFGIDITDLKAVPIKQLPEKLPDKLKGMSAEELNGIINLQGMNTLLDKENTYYFNAGKLYTEKDHINEVDFEYDVDETNTKIQIKSFGPFDIKDDTETPENGKIVAIKIRYLPLSSAFSTISEITGNITLKDLKGYGITLPKFLDKVEYEDKKLTELSSIIDGLHLYEVLGYTKEDVAGEPVYKDEQGTEVKLNEIIKKIISYTVDRLDVAFDEVVQDLKVYEAMGYTQVVEGGVTKYYKDNVELNLDAKENKFLKVIIDKPVLNLSSSLAELKVFDIFDKTGIFNLFGDENPLITDLPTAINNKINGEGEEKGATISELVECGILPSTGIEDKMLNNKKVGDMHLQEFLSQVSTIIDTLNAAKG